MIKKVDIKIYDNVKLTIEKLFQKYKIAIVSNCGFGYIESIMIKMGISDCNIDYIPASVYNISKAKAISKVMKRNNITKAIHVGNTLLDQKSCFESGVDFVYAKYDFGKNVESNLEINTIDELLNISCNINNNVEILILKALSL